MEIPEILRRIDEWWAVGNVPKELVPPTKRRLFDELKMSWDDRRILCVTGPRRTGKSTLMYQLMDMLIREKNVAPKDILFFSGDDLDLRNSTLGDILRAYFEEVLKRDQRDSKCYIFIDEVHKLSDWQLWLKKYYDLKYNIKFVISGSSASKIQSSQKESLAGRIIEYRLYPLDFSEFLSFSGYPVAAKIPPQELTYEGLCEIISGYGQKETLRTRSLLDQYMLVGGFPEWFETNNVRLWQKKLADDVIKRVVYDDIAGQYDIRNPLKIEALLRYLASMSSQLYSYNSIANALKMDNEAAELYIKYLKESFIIFELKNYGSYERQLKKNNKYVLMDIGIKNALERTNAINDNEVGNIMESIIQQHVSWLADRVDANVHYWREKEEVDIILALSNGIVPIEVKYRKTVDIGGLSGIVSFMSRYKLKKGLVITKDTLKSERTNDMELLLIPAWLFLSVI